MLVDNLLAYLTRVVSPVKVTAYKKVLPFLYQLDPGVFEEQFNQFTVYLDEFSTVDNVTQFDSIVVTLLAEGIEQFGFYLTDTLPIYDKMELLARICHALYSVDQHEDTQSIRYALEVGENPREKIADILHLVDNELDPNLVLEICEEISPSLIYRLRDHLQDIEYLFPEESTTDTVLVERVKNALNVFGVERAVRYFKEGGKVGEPLGNYLDYYFSENNQSPEMLARLALFSGIAANLDPAKIKDIVAERIGDYYVDPKTILSISRAIVKLPLPEALYAQA